MKLLRHCLGGAIARLKRPFVAKPQKLQRKRQRCTRSFSTTDPPRSKLAHNTYSLRKCGLIYTTLMWPLIFYSILSLVETKGTKKEPKRNQGETKKEPKWGQKVTKKEPKVTNKWPLRNHEKDQKRDKKGSFWVVPVFCNTLPFFAILCCIL